MTGGPSVSRFGQRGTERAFGMQRDVPIDISSSWYGVVYGQPSSSEAGKERGTACRDFGNDNPGRATNEDIIDSVG